MFLMRNKENSFSIRILIWRPDSPPHFFIDLTCWTSVIGMYIFTSSVDNRMDPDQLASKKQADVD